jgi:tetratricopeptide (TPR) repeat protein
LQNSQEEAVEDHQANRAMEQIMRSMKVAKAQGDGRALDLLDEFLEEAIRHNWVDCIDMVSSHASVLAESTGDLDRAIRYKKQYLPYVPDYAYGLYNLAEMLMRNGSVELAKEYATKSYKLAIAEDTEPYRDLAQAIIKQWPEIRKE